jgi:hypothetical protein
MFTPSLLFNRPSRARSISPPSSGTTSAINQLCAWWDVLSTKLCSLFSLFFCSLIKLWMQDPEKHQELVRSIFQCTLDSLPCSFHHLYSVLELPSLFLQCCLRGRRVWAISLRPMQSLDR